MHFLLIQFSPIIKVTLFLKIGIYPILLQTWEFTLLKGKSPIIIYRAI